MARKHIIVPIEIWNLEGLNVTERLTASVIYGYTENGKPCFMTNTGFAKLLRVSNRTASAAINKLIDEGYVEALEGGSKRTLGWKPASRRVEVDFQGGWKPASTRNNKINTESNNKLNNMVDRKDEVKPIHWQQVRDYFQHLNDREATSHRTHIEPWARDFYAYYDARSWRTKTGPIAKWRPVALAWYRKSAEKVPQRAVKRVDVEALRRDMQWHQRRLDNYLKDERRDLALGEAREIEALKAQIKKHEA